MEGNSAPSASLSTGPGQDLGEIAHGLDHEELQEILGQDVILLVSACVDATAHEKTLRRVAATILRGRADELVAPSAFREICLRHLSMKKREELVQRLDLENWTLLRDTDFTRNRRGRDSLLGFFGVDARAAVAFAKLPERESIRPNFGLFPHQRRVVEQAHKVIRGGHGRVVVHMPTGTGKTRTAMHIVSKVMADAEPCNVVWLAASQELLDQATDAFQHAWSQLGNREINLLRFWGDFLPDVSDCEDCFVTAGLKKLHAFKRRNPIGLLRLAKSTRLVVIDEAHQAIAPTYREVINTLANTGMHDALLGLTATPGRTWADIEADEQLSDFFERRKVLLEIKGWSDPVSYLLENGYLARPKFRKLFVNASAKAKKRIDNTDSLSDYDADILDVLSQELDRNVAIVSEIQRLISEGHKRVLFFSASVRHAEVISAVLMALEIDSYVVTGETDATGRRRIIRDFRGGRAKPIVLCNFGVLTTGFDAPSTSAAVIARPTKSLVLFSQMVGRATRGPKAGGNEECVVSTIIDTDLPGFGDVAEAFMNWEDVWDEPS